jgi:hypothetical protein
MIFRKKAYHLAIHYSSFIPIYELKYIFLPLKGMLLKAMVDMRMTKKLLNVVK